LRPAAVELGFEGSGGGQNHYQVEAIHGEGELIGVDASPHSFGIRAHECPGDLPQYAADHDNRQVSVRLPGWSRY
jgi:hypothetical protein